MRAKVLWISLKTATLDGLFNTIVRGIGYVVIESFTLADDSTWRSLSSFIVCFYDLG